MKRILAIALMVMVGAGSVYGQQRTHIKPNQERDEVHYYEPESQMRVYQSFVYRCEPGEARVYPMGYKWERLCGYVQWEFVWVGKEETEVSYSMIISGMNGFKYVSETEVKKERGKEYGVRDHWFEIPKGLASGFYQMDIKVGLKGVGSKTMSSWFRIY